ncbi:MAG: NBR1-Ig-like domain-containing protein [Anaerolineales bacterium]|nr:NBR1-Ig-like domain-containing protein [Anaerolineales bacterium]
MKIKTTALMTALMIAGLLVSACGGSDAEATPTMSPPEIQTMAVATFSSGLTQTALAAPTDTPTPTSTVTPLVIATLANVTPFGTSFVAAIPTAGCYSMSFVSDVSIPDDTVMTAGQTFTKTWKVKNSGTCAWDAGFKFAFTGGDAMSGATYTLPQSVPANTAIDVSVNMTAPSTTGTIRGNWRMSSATGQFFGDEVYLVIIVGGGTAAPTSTPSATPIP